jgi:hypothetical protein
MDTISKIRNLFRFLPERDIKIADNFLNKRDFLNLKDLVDSDVIKAYKTLERLMPEDTDAQCSEEYVVAQAIYSELKDLQNIVDRQASAFIIDEVEYFEPLDD